MLLFLLPALKKILRAIFLLGVSASFIRILAAQTLPDAPKPHINALLAAPQQNSTTHAKNSTRTQPSTTQSSPNEQTPDLWHRKYLFGEDAERAHLEQHGLIMDFYYVADALAAPTGVHPPPENWWGRIRGTIDVDFGKFTSDKGLGGHITSVWQYGTNIGGTNYVNSYANPSSLASKHVFRAAEYSLSQYLFDNRLEFRGGKLATWNTYGAQEYGESFINEPMGYTLNTFANTYMTYDPGGTPGFEMRVLPTHHYYAKAVVFSQEKSPYTIDPTGFGFHLGPPVVAAETGYLHDPPLPPHATSALGREDFLAPWESGPYPGVFKFGGSYNPTTFTNQLTGRTSSGNYVLWGQADQALYREPGQGPHQHRGLDGTAMIDWSPNDVNQQNQQIDAGLRYIGPIRGPHFAKDMLDFGWVRTSNGSAYRRSLLNHGQGNQVSENLLEFNYLAHVTPWLLFQPTAEFILNPAADPRRPNVSVYGFRILTTF